MASSLDILKACENQNLYLTKNEENILCNELIPKSQNNSNACKQFIEYLSAFDVEDIYFAYVHPSLSTPMSYLGHNFIVFKKKGSWNFSKVYGYSAIIPDKVTLMGLLSDGALGNLQAKYSYAVFHEFIRQYNLVEQRDIELFKIKINYQNKLRLVADSIISHSKIGNYNYFTNNCSSEIVNFTFKLSPKLSEIQQSVHYKQPSLYIEELISTGLIESESIMFHSTLPSLFREYQNFDNSKRILINEVLNTDSKKYDISDLNNAEVKFISDIATVSFLHLKKPVYNYDELKGLEYDDNLPQLNTRALPQSPNRIKLTQHHGESTFQLIGYSPGFVERFEKSNSILNESTIKLLEVIFKSNGSRFDRFQLEQLDVIKLESYKKRFSIYKPKSWKLDLSLHNLSSEISGHFDFGYGISYGGVNTLLAIMPSIYCESNQSTCTPYISNIFSIWFNKINLTLKYNINNGDLKEQKYQDDSNIALNIPYKGMSVMYEHSFEKENYAFSLLWHF